MNKVLVISMEKAGSTTVMHAIRSAGFEVGRVHRHNVYEVNPSDYSHFVTMVREPVARAISNYWETGKQVDIREEINFPLHFFDLFVKPITGIDILPTISLTTWDDWTWDGWGTFGLNKLLVIRVEDFDQYLAHALSIHLQTPKSSFKVEHRGNGLVRFGSAYGDFVKATKFDRDYLEAVYQTPYCQIFGYDEAEKWAK